MTRIVRYQLPALLWAGLIYMSSSMPDSFFPALPWLWVPKVVHFVFFFVLCLFIYRALAHQRVFPAVARFSLFISFALCFLGGVLDEYHQFFVPTRHPRVSDVMIDASGALVLALIIRGWSRLRPGARVPAPDSGTH